MRPAIIGRRAPPAAGRDGLSLIEALLAVTILLMCMGLTGTLAATLFRSQVQVDARSEAILASAVVMQRLQDDWAHVSPRHAGETKIEPGLLRLMRTGQGPATGEEVVYRFEPKTGGLTRNGRSVTSERLEEMTFETSQSDGPVSALVVSLKFGAPFTGGTVRFDGFRARRELHAPQLELLREHSAWIDPGL